jgi:hypothetical protein
MQVMIEFEEKLSEFISGIYDPAIPFLQTDDEQTHKFCPYNSICRLG